jgi:hypothetical protein
MYGALGIVKLNVPTKPAALVAFVFCEVKTLVPVLSEFFFVPFPPFTPFSPFPLAQGAATGVVSFNLGFTVVVTLAVFVNVIFSFTK